MKQIKVAITGNIGSGKSSFTKYLAEKGFPVLNADEISKEILLNDNEIKTKIVKEFGEKVYSNGKPDKEYLAGYIFSDSQKLKKINSILHPSVIKKIDSIISQKYSNEPVIFIESALVYEAKIEKLFDYIVLITANEKIRLQRTVAGNKFSANDFKKRNQNQLPDEEKISRADFVFYNDSKLDELYKKADLLIFTLKSL